MWEAQVWISDLAFVLSWTRSICSALRPTAVDSVHSVLQYFLEHVQAVRPYGLLLLIQFTAFYITVLNTFKLFDLMAYCCWFSSQPSTVLSWTRSSCSALWPTAVDSVHSLLQYFLEHVQAVRPTAVDSVHSLLQYFLEHVQAVRPYGLLLLIQFTAFYKVPAT